MKHQTSGRDRERPFHAVRFYDSKASLCRIVAEFLCEGLAAGQPALVIATAPHRQTLIAELRAGAVDVDALQQGGDLLLLDARQVLASFMFDGMPDRARFRTSVTTAFDRLCRGRQGCAIRAYGEMVDVLWQDGHADAAIRLETLWNELAITHDFSLLCGYAIGSFYKDAGMREVCAQHSHVVPAENSLDHRPQVPSN